ncbi:hypothetical protein HDR63_02385 [bacterium]|nr:hypothetical protein [bacterium]
MKGLSKFLFYSSMAVMMPVAAQAAGTYYTGGYQANQAARYNQMGYGANTARGYQQSTYNNANRNAAMGGSYAASRNGATASNNRTNTATTQSNGNAGAQQKTATASQSNKATQGFYLDAGLSHEMAQWRFEMKESGSILHYDNIGWNVLDLNGGYNFKVGNTPMSVMAGFKYGMQMGDSSMVDDDITNGGTLVTRWVDANGNLLGEQVGHALSVSTSSGGNMMGFNLGLGVPNFFKWGNVRMTPSVGYRYFKYELESKSTYGLSVDTAACFQMADGEVQCDPIVIFYDATGSESVIFRDDTKAPLPIHSGATGIGLAGTYYYELPGTSHSYKVGWSGPYVAMDMDYVINASNAINARVELGLPAYNSEADQPYRIDWAHPKSVEDSAGIGSAFHLGMGANWTTAINSRVSLSLGLTFDYYTVGDADAKTYLNGTYYTDIYNDHYTDWVNNPQNLDKSEAAMLNSQTGDQVAIAIKNLEAACPGWVCTADGEIESFYKSMGFRVGLNARF